MKKKKEGFLMDNLALKGIADFVVLATGYLTTILFGSWLPLMTTLLIVQGVDIVTGVWTAGSTQEGEKISSRRFFDGLKRKGAAWMLIILANAIDNIAFGELPVAKTATVSFLIGYEGISITENLALLGVPVPKFIQEHLEKLRDDNDTLNENEEEGLD